MAVAGPDDNAPASTLRIGGGTERGHATDAGSTERHVRVALVAKHYRAAQRWDHEGWQRHRADDGRGGG